MGWAGMERTKIEHPRQSVTRDFRADGSQQNFPAHERAGRHGVNSRRPSDCPISRIRRRRARKRRIRLPSYAQHSCRGRLPVLYDEFRDEGSGDFLYKMSLHGPQITARLTF
jgi:hypothetical protein